MLEKRPSKYVPVNWLQIRQVLEIRYQRGYAHWDCSGRVANSLLELFPGLRVTEGDPSQVALDNSEQQIQLRFGVDKSVVSTTTLLGPNDHFQRYAEPFFELIFRSFDIRSVSRVGHRIFYNGSVDSETTVSDHIEKLGLNASAGGSFFSTSDDPRLRTKKLAAFCLTFEDEKVGIRVNVSEGTSNVEVAGPYAEEIRKHLPPPAEVVDADFDVYTLKPLNVSDLLITELTKSNAKMVKTRILPLLEG